MDKKAKQAENNSSRREFVRDLTLMSTGAAVATSPLAALAQTKSTKTGTVRVWGNRAHTARLRQTP